MGRCAPGATASRPKPTRPSWRSCATSSSAPWKRRHRANSEGPAMTYTILGHCVRTGALGIGVATYSLAVGGLCPAIRSNVGVLTSQAFVNPELRGLGAALLASGFPAEQVVAQLKAADSRIEYR